MVTGQIWPLYKLQKYHGRRTWAGYVSTFQIESNYIYHNDPPNQRLAICKECGIPIPREIPRIYLRASHSYRAGNYCIRCGIAILKGLKEDHIRIKELMEQHMKELDKVVEAADKTKADEYFQDKTNVQYLAKKISDK